MNTIKKNLMGKKSEFEKKENVERFFELPKRRLSDVEKQLIFVLIEKNKLQRERSMAILNKGFMAFMIFIVIAYLSRTSNIIPELYVNILFIFSIVVLVVVVITYQTTMSKEEKVLDNLLDSFIK